MGGSPDSGPIVRTVAAQPPHVKPSAMTDPIFLCLAALSVGVFYAAVQARRQGNEKRDVALIAAFATLLGSGATAVALI